MQIAKSMLLAGLVLIAQSFVSSLAKADAAIEPVVAVGGTTGNCALVQVAAGNFNSGGYLAIDLTTTGGKAAYAAASMALALGRHIWVNRVSQAAGCYGLTDYASDLRVLNY